MVSSEQRLPTIVFGLVAVALTECSPQPCDSVKPLQTHPQFALVHTERPVVMLYEYVDDHGLGMYQITGRSISFVADSFRSNWSEVNGGPQYDVSFQYRVVGRDPQGRPLYVRADKQKPGGGEYNDTIRVYLYATGILPPQLSLSLVAKGALPLEIETQSRTAGRLEPDRCGFKVTSFDPRFATTEPAEVTRSWLYGRRPVLLGSLREQGIYQPYIACGDYIIPRTGAPVCSIYSDYHGWLLQISFADGHLCDAQERIADARTFFDQRLVSETPRAPGFREYRWPTGPHPEKDHSCPRPGSFAAWLASFFNKK